MGCKFLQGSSCNFCFTYSICSCQFSVVCVHACAFLFDFLILCYITIFVLYALTFLWILLFDVILIMLHYCYCKWSPLLPSCFYFNPPHFILPTVSLGFWKSSLLLSFVSVLCMSYYHLFHSLPCSAVDNVIRCKQLILLKFHLLLHYVF